MPAVRFAFVLAGGLWLAMVAVHLKPAGSQADQLGPAVLNPVPGDRLLNRYDQIATEAAPDHDLIGQLVGREYLVKIHAGTEGARYSVCTLYGETIAARLKADEVYQRFPELDIEAMRLDPADEQLGQQLMMVDPDF